jgi:UrcA family protein
MFAKERPSDWNSQPVEIQSFSVLAQGWHGGCNAVGMNGFNRSETMTTTTFSPFRNLALAVVASATVLGFAAAPAEASDVRTASIEVRRAELFQAAGREAVESRVLMAAGKLCAEGGVDWKNLTETASYKLCVATAVRDARIQMAAMTAGTQLAAAQ